MIFSKGVGNVFPESSLVKSRETRNTSFSDFSFNSNTPNLDDFSDLLSINDSNSCGNRNFNSERVTRVRYSFELDSEEEIDSNDDSEFVYDSSNESSSPRKYSIETKPKNVIFHPDVVKNSF